jgi:16S rRNA (uracil1498-N3)-methyltransferase
MPNSKPKIRLFVESSLKPAIDVTVDEAQAHYLAHVMRVRSGESLLLFNGRDGEWMSRVTNIGKNLCSVSVERQTRNQQSEQGPWLAFAPVKKNAVDFIAEKATELGASRLCPIFTSQTAVTRVHVRRLRANAIEAAEQSERLTVPDVMDPAPFDDLVFRWPADRTLFILHGRGQGLPVFDQFAAIRSASSAWQSYPPGFLIGPEGGLSPSELDLAANLPFVSVIEMGPRVLRCETAALAVLACWQAIAGDWRERPGPQDSNIG